MTNLFQNVLIQLKKACEAGKFGKEIFERMATQPEPAKLAFGAGANGFGANAGANAAGGFGAANAGAGFAGASNAWNRPPTAGAPAAGALHRAGAREQPGFAARRRPGAP